MESNQQVVDLMHSPLHISCIKGDEENLNKLISSGGIVDINEFDRAGCTPIQLSSAGGFLKIVQLLLQNGAKPEIQDTSHGNTSLHEAAWRGYSCLVKILSSTHTINVQNYGGFSPLHLSCQAGHNQSTRELLLAGAQPNVVNTYGDTPLHTSVRYGHAGVARILLSARAEADIQNKNGDTALHISSAMGRKKLTKILLSSGCNPELKNHQNESPLDISIRKKFEDVTNAIRNPPKVLTPMQRDEMRASKIKLNSPGHSTNSNSKSNDISLKVTNTSSPGRGQCQGRIRMSLAAKNEPELGKSEGKYEKRMIKYGPKGSKNNNSNNNNLKDKVVNDKEECSRVAGQSSSLPEGGTSDVPNWSPYGCHYHPNPGAFPSPNIDSLPKEPLTTGELYYLDLAGNIHKGPMGVSEGCYCNTLLSQNPNSQSMIAINHAHTSQQQQPQPHHHHQRHSPHHHHSNKKQDPLTTTITANKYEAQLKSLTNQLSKIHLDTQAQLSSLHSMLNERLRDSHDSPYNEIKLKEWVKQYRRFRKELSKNPKTLSQANELLSNASALLSTRLPSPGPPDSETDSGI